jgi:hypothetical protein
LDLWKNGHYAHECPDNEASRRTKGKFSEQKGKEAQEKRQVVIRAHCNRCGSQTHDTNSCPYNPHRPKEEVHLLKEGCCSSSETSQSEISSDEEILIHQSCTCTNPNYCTCSSQDSESNSSDSEPMVKEKLKVCMFLKILETKKDKCLLRLKAFLKET